MAFNTSKQPTSEKRDYYSSFQKTPKKHVLEALRSKLPSEELRERRRRCFIASSYSKNCREPLVLDTSKSKRFTLAMKEDEEIEFFQSLWKNLPAMTDDDVANVSPVANESTRPSESDSSGLARQTRGCNQQPTMKPIQVGAITTSHNQGGDFGVTKDSCIGHDEDIGCVKTKGRLVEPNFSEKSYFSEIEAKKISVGYHPESKTRKLDSYCNISDVGDSRDETRRVSVVKNSRGVDPGVHCRPVESSFIDDGPNGPVYVRICPTETSNQSQSNLCLKENIAPKRMSREIRHVDHVASRNVCTQTSPIPSYNRNDSDHFSVETKRRYQRDWYRNNGNAYEKRVSRGFYTHRRSPSCHAREASTIEQPKMSYAKRRFQKYPPKDFIQNTFFDRRFNPRPSSESSRRPRSLHVDDDNDNSDCDCNNFSRRLRTNGASNRECSCSSNFEKSCSQMPSVGSASNVTLNSRMWCQKNGFKRRMPMAGDMSSRVSSCLWRSDVTPRGQKSSSDSETSRGSEARVIAPRRVLVCPMCGVIVSSKKSMAAHINGARHSRTAGEAERQGVNTGQTRNNHCKVLTCRMAYAQQPLMPVLEYVLVKNLGKHLT